MKSVLLIGLGRFGKQLAIQLNELGHDVMGIDHNEERVNEAIDIVTDAQIGDSTNEDFLRSLGVRSFDICYVTISNDFQSSLDQSAQGDGCEIHCFPRGTRRSGKVPAP